MRLSTRTSFAAAVALGTFALVGGTGLTVSSAWLITMASQHPPILALSVSIVMVRFFGIFRSVARYGERVVSHEAIFKKLTGIRVAVFNSIASQLRSQSAGLSTQSKAMIDDVERAQEYHLRVTLPGISALGAGLVTLLLAAWISPLMLIWIAIAMLIFSVVIPVLVKVLLDPLAVEIEERENRFTQEISGASHAMVEAEIFGYADQYRARLEKQIRNLQLLERRNFLLTSLMQFLTIGTIGFTLTCVAVTVQKSAGLLPIQISMAIFLVLVGFEGYTSWFPNLFPAGKNRRASQSVESIIASHLDAPAATASPRDSSLVLTDVIPYWEEEFLAPVSFTVNPGETLVITGASGIGKSTLAAALFGLAHFKGCITIGGVDLSEIGSPSDYICGSLQHGHIFNTTLRENLKISSPRATDEELQSLLHSLELDSIGLDEMVGEFGRALSGGEAKRLAVARALLSEAAIVVLDEPLEHLDQERAVRIQRAISAATVDRALIVITHSPWLQYSRKLVLERE